MIDEIGRLGCQAWAVDFMQRHGTIVDKAHLATVKLDEAAAPDSENGFIRRAMAHIDLDLFVCALVYFSSAEPAYRKCRHAASILGKNLSQRSYQTNLDRLWHFVAGRMIERPAATAYRTSAAAGNTL